MDRSGGPVGIHSLAADGQPLLVADVAGGEVADVLEAALVGVGLVRLPGLIGVELPRGAGVGVQLEGREARLLDAQDTTLLRFPRAGLSSAWQRAALARRGTVLVVARELGVGADVAPAALGAALETTARDGRILGAIVGVHDRPPRLPLLV